MKCAVFAIDGTTVQFVDITTFQDLKNTNGSAYRAAGRRIVAIPLVFDGDWNASKVFNVRAGTLDDALLKVK